MSQTLHLVAGDTAPTFRTVLSNADGPQDLTAVDSVVMRMKPPTGDVVDIDMDVDPDQTANKGVVTHDWTPDEVAEAISYTVEFIVTYADETEQTFPLAGSDVPKISFRARKTA